MQTLKFDIFVLIRVPDVAVTYWKHSKEQIPSHAVSKCICIKLKVDS